LKLLIILAVIEPVKARTPPTIARGVDNTPPVANPNTAPPVAAAPAKAKALDIGETVRVYVFEDDWIDLKIERYEKPNLQPNNYILCQEPKDYLV